jgi:hypothetical protein
VKKPFKLSDFLQNAAFFKALHLLIVNHICCESHGTVATVPQVAKNQPKALRIG